MNYLRYHIASGSIFSRLVLDPRLAVEADPEYALIEGDGTQEAHWVNEGEIAPRTPCEGVSVTPLVQTGADPAPILTALPDPCWVRVRGVSGQYEVTQLVEGGTMNFIPSIAGTYVATLEGEHTGPDMPFEVIDLDAVKQRRNDEVTARKATALLAGVEWNGHRWDADEDAKVNIGGVASAIASGLALPEGFYWTDFDNQNVPMTAADVVALGNAIVEFTFAVHANSRDLKAAIQNCATIAQVEAIDIEAGWPSDS